MATAFQHKMGFGLFYFTFLVYVFSDPSLVEIYQERRTGGVDYTSHDLHELGVTVLDNITFKVKAANDACILLRRNWTDYQGQIVEVVIGGLANRKSVIRSSQQQDPPEAEYLASGLLSPDEYRSFWISWVQGTVMVGTGSSPWQKTIMVWGGLEFNVTYIAVGVGYGSDAHWQFTRACSPCPQKLGDSDFDQYCCPDPNNDDDSSKKRVAMVILIVIPSVLVVLAIAYYTRKNKCNKCAENVEVNININSNNKNKNRL